jgi:hypothetical protein
VEPISVTYRRGIGAWDVFLSCGERLAVTAGPDEAGLAEARAVARRHTLGRTIAVERVDVTTDTVEWRGLRFESLATTYGVEDPSLEQVSRLRACWEHYRQNLPPDMKVELYGNRVRIEPGAFGRRGDLLDAIGGFLAGAVPDDHTLAVAPRTHGVDHAREQFRRIQAVAVPDGFVRIVHEFTGFEDDGEIGTVYLVLKDRWNVDRPF